MSVSATMCHLLFESLWSASKKFAFQYQVKRSRILFRRASPVSPCGGVKRHQVGKADLHRLGRIANHCQAASVVKQSEGGHLPRNSSACLEDLESNSVAPTLLCERPHRRLQVLITHLAGIERQGSSVLRRQFKPLRVDINRHDRCPERGCDLRADAGKYGKISPTMRS